MGRCFCDFIGQKIVGTLITVDDKRVVEWSCHCSTVPTTRRKSGNKRGKSEKQPGNAKQAAAHLPSQGGGPSWPCAIRFKQAPSPPCGGGLGSGYHFLAAALAFSRSVLPMVFSFTLSSSNTSSV